MSRAEDFLSSLILFSQESYINKSIPFAKPDPYLARDWVSAKHVVTGQSHYVPASLAFMRYPEDGALTLDHAYSIGRAYHTCLGETLLSSLCELIERDTYSCYLLSKLLPLCFSNVFVLENLPTFLAQEIVHTGLYFKVMPLT